MAHHRYIYTSSGSELQSMFMVEQSKYLDIYLESARCYYDEWHIVASCSWLVLRISCGKL